MDLLFKYTARSKSAGAGFALAWTDAPWHKDGVNIACAHRNASLSQKVNGLAGGKRYLFCVTQSSGRAAWCFISRNLKRAACRGGPLVYQTALSDIHPG